MNHGIKESHSSETFHSYSSERNNWTESRLNGFHIYFSSKKYYHKGYCNLSFYVFFAKRPLLYYLSGHSTLFQNFVNALCNVCCLKEMVD